MSHKVVFLQTAVDDLHEVRRYIRKHFTQTTWLNAYSKIKKAILKLEQFPNAGHALPELPATHFLEIFAVKNRVIYEVIGDRVYIHIICDARQDFKTKLTRRPVQTLRAKK
ncbi:type II toxin-antitoxin system RelE/ParE family toxin [Achromobacter sp. SD115]|uniref:type II toxin-antitoxin system RelE/ParE family toxin n=1 Tax=Achromobacter sp. SD115 TaxID=2782011 RepID=UPI001A979A4E|nr:type II toxin-antitoxin system RelE/ParE family toxin [Achromobacter sp. SD115]MBO1015633.1 type II toxin-antitoxin system RelE/ParE family toxin [Achromobacter sp. SD115]